MDNDGDLDPSGYTRAQLVLALGSISRERYPRNFAILSQELASRRAIEEQESSTSSAREPWAQEAAPVKQTLIAGLICGACLLAYVLMVGVTAMFIPLRTNPWMFFVALAIAVHITAFLYCRRIGKQLAGDRLLWLTVGCAAPFCLFDIGLPKLLAAVGLTPRGPEEHWMDVVLLPGIVDVLIVAAMVYITVPIAQKRYVRAKVA